jgi:hypothetical protein
MQPAHTLPTCCARYMVVCIILKPCLCLLQTSYNHCCCPMDCLLVQASQE